MKPTAFKAAGFIIGGQSNLLHLSYPAMMRFTDNIASYNF